MECYEQCEVQCIVISERAVVDITNWALWAAKKNNYPHRSRELVSQVCGMFLGRNFNGIRDSATPKRVLFVIPPKFILYLKQQISVITKAQTQLLQFTNVEDVF